MSLNNVFERGRIKYVEPTNIYDDSGNLAIRSNEIIKNDLEDYCIAVDLAVIIPDRKSCGLSKESGEQMVLNYSSDKGTISFLNGTDGVLTTNFTDVNLLNPSKNTNECLGITSIDVTYDAWQYPEVNIKFVDVRGASVMSIEEQAFQNKVKDGGSFYRSLFTCPYPMFILKLKGFYGKGATYYLSVEDVKIALDSSSGNYEIDVKFIGMMYRVYTDIPMTYVCAAPYMQAGAAYWSSKVSSGKFVFRNSDGTVTDMIKIPELTEKIAKASECQEKIGSEEGDVVRKSDELINELNFLKTNFPLNDWEYDSKNKVFFKISPVSVDNIENNISEYLESAKNCPLNGFLKDVKNALGYDENEKFKVGKLTSTYYTIDSEGRYSESKNDGKIKSKGKTGLVSDFGNKIDQRWNNFWIYGIEPIGLTITTKEDLIKRIFDVRIEEALKQKLMVVDDYKSKKQSAIEKALGFTPSIRNIYNLVFAHMDTFINTFYECTRNIKSQLDSNDDARDLKNYGTADSDLQVSETQVPPFTEFLSLDISSNSSEGDYAGGTPGVTRKTPIWLEDLNMGKRLEETNYVLDLLYGANMLFDALQESGSTYTGGTPSSDKKIERDGGYEAPSIDVSKFVPVTAYDLRKNNGRNNPYKTLDLDDTSLEPSILAIFATRAFTYLSTIEKFNSSDTSETFGRIEAENLYRAFGDNISSHFLDVLDKYADGNKNTSTKNDLKDFIKTIESQNPYWSFDDTTNPGGLFKEIGDSLVYSWQKDLFLPLNLGSLPVAKRNFLRDKDELLKDVDFLDTTKNIGSKKSYYCFSDKDYIDNIFNQIQTTFRGKTESGDSNDNKLREAKINAIKDKFIWKYDKSSVFPYKNGILYDATKEIENYNSGKTSGKKILLNDKDIVNKSKFEDILAKKNDSTKDNYFISYNINRDAFKDEKDTLKRAYKFLENLPFSNNFKDELKYYKFKNGIRLKSVLLLEASIYWGMDNGMISKTVVSNSCSKSRKEGLKQLFESWANGEFSSIFPKLIDNDIYSGDKLDINKALKLRESEIPQETLSNAVSVQDFLRDLLLDFYTEIDFYYDNEILSCEKTKISNAFKGFMIGLKNHYKREVVTSKKSRNEALKSYTARVIEDPFKNKDIKLSTYLTLKNLYDKWLCFPYKGIETWQLGSKESDFNSFVYIDSFYHDIGSELLVNITKVNEWLRSCFPSAEVETMEGLMNYVGKSVYQFLSEVAQDSGGVLMAFPQKIGGTDSMYMHEMFDAMPYNSNWDTDSSCFVFIYSYKPSEHLGNDDYKDDGIDFLAEELESSLGDNGYFIPAFGVTYAKQNQAFFKNITLSTDKATTTEASIRATMDIAARGGSDGSGPRTTSLFGQDLYSVRTNYAYECEFDMMGCIQVMPLMYFQLNNVPFWRGGYMIYKVTHNITAGDMTTHVTGVRMSKNSLPIVESSVIASKAESTNTQRPASTAVDDRNYNYSYDGVISHDASVTYNPDLKIKDTIDFKEENVSDKKPIICVTPAHGPKTQKSAEWYWSSMVTDRICSTLRAMRYKDGTPFNVQRCNVNGAHTSNGYSMQQTRDIITKYGQDKVISIVPHWNGAAGTYIIPFTGGGNNQKPQREDSLKLCEYFRNAVDRMVVKNCNNYAKMPSGMMSKGVLETRKLPEKNSDGAAQVSCACMLSENFFADYGDKSKFRGSYETVIKELDPNFPEANRTWSKQGSDGKYLCGEGWLLSDEGINAIAEAHIEAIKRYVDGL